MAEDRGRQEDPKLKCVKVFACVVVGRAFCFDVYVAAVRVSNGAGKCHRKVDSGVLLMAETRREETARAYDGFDEQTRQATKMLEILTAYCVLPERADFELRTRAA